MWSKGEAKALRQQFWTALGQYLQPVPSAEGQRINWINYKTDNKAVRVRMTAEKGLLRTIISVESAEEDLKNTIWQTLYEQRSLLPAINASHWVWDQQSATITCSLEGVHVLQQAHWPQAISFFKQSLVLADAWWCGIKYSLPNTDIDF